MSKAQMYEGEPAVKFRFYLAGPMDRVPDGGEGWRKVAAKFLEECGAIAHNPCTKQSEVGKEDAVVRAKIAELKLKKEWDEVARLMEPIRTVDLSLVRQSDALICYMDIDVHMCGSYEEIYLAHRLGKRVFLVCPQGKAGVPNWLFDVLDHNLFFGTFDELYNFLSASGYITLPAQASPPQPAHG